MFHKSISRRSFIATAIAGATAAVSQRARAAEKRPNILFAIADDWSWPHASAHGAPEISTPNFDRVAREGCLFNNAFTAAPQCSPNRAATLTGRYIWEIEEAGTHGSIFPKKYPVFTHALEEAGYHVGSTGKAWGPGDWKRGGFDRNPVGKSYIPEEKLDVPAYGINRIDYAGGFKSFLEARKSDAPFFFWYGASEPHRRYEEGAGKRLGKDPSKAELPKFLPDHDVMRNDLLDYFVEVEHFDTQLGEMIGMIEAMGELDNTVIVVTSDNGMPFPGAKANLYEHGTHVPLAICWPAGMKSGRTVEDLVSFIDLAPTFLDLAGVDSMPSITGRSFRNVLEATNTSGMSDPTRTSVLTGRERHTHARYDNLGYPGRAIRTPDYLYIHNVKPDRWPAGDPEGYHDIDDCPAKTFLMENREEYPVYFRHSFGKRPEEELYDIRKDPACMNNLAGDAAHEDARKKLAVQLDHMLLATNDPRVLGNGDIFESYPRVSRMRPQLGGFAERGAYNPKYGPVPDEPAPE